MFFMRVEWGVERGPQSQRISMWKGTTLNDPNTPGVSCIFFRWFTLYSDTEPGAGQNYVHLSSRATRVQMVSPPTITPNCAKLEFSRLDGEVHWYFTWSEKSRSSEQDISKEYPAHNCHSAVRRGSSLLMATVESRGALISGTHWLLAAHVRWQSNRRAIFLSLSLSPHFGWRAHYKFFAHYKLVLVFPGRSPPHQTISE